jgi:hypothetical protein
MDLSGVVANRLSGCRSESAPRHCSHYGGILYRSQRLPCRPGFTVIVTSLRYSVGSQGCLRGNTGSGAGGVRSESRRANCRACWLHKYPASRYRSTPVLGAQDLLCLKFIEQSPHLWGTYGGTFTDRPRDSARPRRCFCSSLATSRSICRAPPFQALRDTRALPASVLGPVDRSHGFQNDVSLARMAVSSLHWRMPMPVCGEMMTWHNCQPSHLARFQTLQRRPPWPRRRSPPSRC